MSYIYIFFIALSFVTSIFSYSDQRHPYLKIFSPFLFATLIAESFGAYLKYINKSNLYIYNFFTVVEFCFYMFLITLIINNTKAIKIIRIGGFFYAILSISNILFFQGMKDFHTITYSLGCLAIVTVCFYYFFEIFRLPKSVKLSRDPAFWICSGHLFFYCCGFPLYAFVNFWMRFDLIINNIQTFITILNIFLYSLFTIAFICNRTRKYISSPS